MFLFMDQKDLIVHCRLPPLYRLFLIMTVELSMGENSNIYELISLTLSFTNFYTFGVISIFHINLRYKNLILFSLYFTPWRATERERGRRQKAI